MPNQARRSKEYQDALRKQREVIRKLQEEVFSLHRRIAELELEVLEYRPKKKTPEQQEAEDRALIEAHQQIGKILSALGVPEETQGTFASKARLRPTVVPKHEQETHDFEVDSAGRTTDYRGAFTRRRRQPFRDNLVGATKK